MRGTSRSGSRGTHVTIAVVLMVLLTGVAVAGGQSRAAGSVAPGARPQKNATPPPEIRVQSNLVTAPVAVIDRATGEYVYDLDKSDFEIYDDGVPQKIELFDREPHKIAAVIVIQDSDSVAPLLNQIKSLSSLFSELLLGSKGEAAVIVYDGQVHQAQDFSSSASVLDKTFMGITADGSGARLNDAIMQAMNLLQKRPKRERRVIVVLSTGYDSGSSTSKQEVIRRATHAEVEIYGLALSLSRATLTRKPQPQVAQNPLDANVTGPSLPGQVPTPSSSQQSFGVPANITRDLSTAAKLAKSKVIRDDLSTYCRYTGGVAYRQWSLEAMQVHLNQIAADVHSQYELAYVPDDLSRLGFHRLRVEVKRPGVEVRTRLGYFYEGP